MQRRLTRLLAVVTVVGAMLALSTAPVGAQDDFDAEAASAEVQENLIALFDALAVAGNPDTAPEDVEAALATAAGLVEGGDSPEVQEQIPGIAALAAAAELSIVIDEEPTFDESGTRAEYVFSALSFGNPSQVNEANGVHVLENGVWKLSSEIWGAFVALGSGASPDDVDDGAEGGDGGGEGADGGGEGDGAGEEELADTGLSSDALAVLAVAVLGAGAMLVASGRRTLTD
jgi:hypothetical protein